MSSLRKLADDLNLSHATVSAALRGLPGVKSSTRERVLLAAEQKGYRLNTFASALMGAMRRSRNEVFRGVIAILRLEAPDAKSPRERDHRRTIEGAMRRAAEFGFQTEAIVVGKNGYAWDRLHTILETRGVQALVVLAPEDPRLLQRIDRVRIRCVCAGLAEGVMNGVSPDRAGAVRLSVQHLHSAGFRRPGLMLRREAPLELLRLWDAAFCAAGSRLNAGGLERPSAPFLFSEQDVGEFDFLSWLQAGRHDSVIADAPLPEAWLAALEERTGRADAVRLLNVDPGDVRRPGTDLNWERVGERSVDQLVYQILRNEPPSFDDNVTTLCQSTWIEARSCAPAFV